ncbi:GNAT family N-acetyltransferase [Aspergillus alliaceus]|uniref:GNAT family N-acetyltransferase n=1 Tax=Petromyces alliaceus TaxID=209559 RepID=UPI0012A59B9A|nr:acyl-CoA N-acyltransferase [Aspergillus alliaceus]KAB8227289.1 acyl-CoA N-acyltransferase [Aspergillus alliaceus]
MDIHVRPETQEDTTAIERVTIAAFLNTKHSSATEQYIVRDLRESKQLSISLVAEMNDNVVGHVAISPVHISDASTDWYGVGPVSILPEYQRQGIGSLLMKRALHDLQTRNAAGCVVLGDPAYYTRFGFRVEPSLQFPDVPAEYFMALTFRGLVPNGTVTYSKAFESKE